MNFQEVQATEKLRQYIKCYYFFESVNDGEFDDIVFPSGLMEIVFNLGEGTWEIFRDGSFNLTPKVELWGQISKPLHIRSKGRHSMLGIKFLPHTPSCFLKDDISRYNNKVFDLRAIMGLSVGTVHSKLLETPNMSKRIELIEDFLLKILSDSDKEVSKVDKVRHILSNIGASATERNISSIAFEHGITSRYLHKLIHQYTGLSPKSIDKINRFQRSLKLMAKNEQPLTSIAYDCGYFDQSHFIRDFRSFTNITPSAYLQHSFPVNQLFLQ